MLLALACWPSIYNFLLKKKPTNHVTSWTWKHKDLDCLCPKSARTLIRNSWLIPDRVWELVWHLCPDSMTDLYSIAARPNAGHKIITKVVLNWWNPFSKTIKKSKHMIPRRLYGSTTKILPLWSLRARTICTESWWWPQISTSELRQHFGLAESTLPFTCRKYTQTDVPLSAPYFVGH